MQPGLISVYPWYMQGPAPQVSNGERARKRPLRFTMVRITLDGISFPIPQIRRGLERLSDMADLARPTQITAPFSRRLSIGCRLSGRTQDMERCNRTFSIPI